VGPEWLIAVSQLNVVIFAYVGKLFLKEKAEAYGAPRQAIVMPKGEPLLKKANNQRKIFFIGI